MLITLISTVAVLVMAVQPVTPPAVPAGWHVRADGGGAHAGHAMPAAAGAAAPAEVSFVDMPPGWHVTTGPSVILFQPERTASGAYSVRSESFLFDPGTRREGYGLLIGGRDLDGPGQRYTYFLIRRSGEFMIRRRMGETVSTVRDWTPHTAILQYDQRGEAHTAKNELGIDATPTEVVFLVNGSEVARVPRTDVDADGVVGLRINHHLNLHVSTLDVTAAR